MGAQRSERDNVLSVREAEVQRLRALTAAGDIEIQRLRGLTATPPSRNGSEAPGAPGDSAVEAAADGEPAADGGATTDGDPEAGTQRTADAEHQDGTDGTNGTDGPQGTEGTGSPEDGHEAGDGSDPAPGPAQGQRPSVRAAMRNGARVALRGGRRGGEDDFERIEGIGPRIATALREAGIRSYRQLADSEVSRLQSALEASGLRFAPSLPTWSQQAALLARGDEEGFAALTATLVAARQRAGRS
jgi:predicted flap endonuclease-1-like 5' DNA nuclease